MGCKLPKTPRQIACGGLAVDSREPTLIFGVTSYDNYSRYDVWRNRAPS